MSALLTTVGSKLRRSGLLGLFVIQFACVAFLIVEGIVDIIGTEHRHLEVFEYPFVIALTIGLCLTIAELRSIVRRTNRMEAQLRVASGAFSELLDDHFEEWNLTPSERDVAMLAIKGLTISEIADLRQTREGTIKAQCNSIYRKAGVSGRAQLLSSFIEELMGENLTCPFRRRRTRLDAGNR